MKYAPVIITTLNRVEHLKRCLESLNECTGAEKTDVYVSVDFPPTEKYREGYETVCSYLKSSRFCFKSFIIYYQSENLGPAKNMQFLEKHVRELSDTYIVTEDDNEFSKNFLDYINKGLQKYREDSEVIAICAYKDTDWEFCGKKTTKVKLFPAYGYGMWFSKNDKMYAEEQQTIFLKKNQSFFNVLKLYKKNKCIFCQYVSQILCATDGFFWLDDKLIWYDSVLSLYMHLTEKTVVVPQVSKSRTWGNDGSGVNMPNLVDTVKYEKKEIDQASEFEFEEEEVEFNVRNYAVGDEYLRMLTSAKSVLVTWIKYIILVMCRYDRIKTARIVKIIENRIKALLNIRRR